VNYPDGVVGIPYFDGYVEKAALDFLEQGAKAGKPFFLNVNFMVPPMAAKVLLTARRVP
jgi:hypothetical protein